MGRAATPEDFGVLGLRPGASADEIRTAYRRLAKIHHPDRNPGDAGALETFRRVTESYAALRERSRLGPGPPRPSPLSAAGAARSRAAPRRADRVSPTRLVDLPVGGSLWVDGAALLVAPDRTAALRPGATGAAYPDATRVIRVEHRADGLHVFMPPQPSARWPVGSEANTEGLAVASLWVGDRQDDDAASPPAARLPLRLLAGTVGEMAVGARGWAPAEALAVDAQGLWTVDLAQPVSGAPHPQTPLRILRDSDGYRVHADLPASAWPPGEPSPGSGWGQVVDAILAGQGYPRPPD